MKKEENIGYLLNRLTSLLNSVLTQDLNKFNLTRTQWAVLITVYFELANTPSAIAAWLKWDRPTTSGVILRLLKQGWIVSHTDKKDRRSQKISLTEDTASMMPELIFLNHKVIAAALQGFTEDQEKTLIELLKKSIANLE